MPIRVYTGSLDTTQASIVKGNSADLKCARVERMNEDARLLFHQHNAQNKINYRRNQGNNELDANYEQYLLQFYSPDKMPLADYPYSLKSAR